MATYVPRHQRSWHQPAERGIPEDIIQHEISRSNLTYPASQYTVGAYSTESNYRHYSQDDECEEEHVDNDCCLTPADPLLSGPGKINCTIATALFITFIVMLLSGTIATLLHYAAGIEFNTLNRGRVVGPILLGLSPIPLVFTVFFACRARSQVVSQVRQMKRTHSARERIAYKQHQKVNTALRTLEVDSLADMLAREKSLGTYKKDSSGSVGLLWLKRTYEFLVNTLWYLSQSDDETSMRSIISRGYELSLSKYHNRFMRNAFHVVLYTLPKRSTFIKRLAYEQDNREPEILKGALESVERFRPLVGELHTLLVDYQLEKQDDSEVTRPKEEPMT